MTNPGDSDEWWKQYGGQGVSPESGTPGSVPQYPNADPSGYSSAPQYPQQPAQPLTPQPQPQQQYGQPYQSQPQPYQPSNYQYQAPYQPYGYPQQLGTNGMAIGSLVASLLGLVTCGISSIVGIILGVVALNQIKQNGQEGRGLALSGIWVGAVIVGLVVLWFILVLISAASSST
ncbi:DUF4190 domain-containing protein [Nocardia sp. NPDC052566]|uniref:DUF4190 domain-containing protein n=1 Tax=Nocardia sp. NPDC052566 TaxID=3364330 RepID=UPI0037CC791E